MRTTLNIEEEALSKIREYAEERGVSLGRAVSDLVNIGAESRPKFKMKNGWVQFELPPGTPPMTLESLKQMEEADYEEEYRRAMSPRR